MMRQGELERLQTASERFSTFFGELREVFIEREDVLEQLALALLGREHVLMTGPPGTGKSALASAVIGRIPDERTGRPSVFSRQVTESTVNTDLVGPIDFKTLMSSGRTEHFTDEGILGAVHAFLDEVLDGRDMLLRSTLNLLQERELKHGGRVTKGDVECALMTTNRYVSDVLEHSRETLLAFLDRVAFLSFVPRGFADAENMKRLLEAMVGGGGFARLQALLTVQDLDALQAATDAVVVPKSVSDALADFLRDFEHEVVEARRADPSFTPTRYLSTRTAVRLGRVLRASVVYSRIFEEPKRGLRARVSDFERLRLSLLLTGPRHDQIEALLADESDPKERRQLEILRREREIFDACLARLPAETKQSSPPRVRMAPLRKQFELARHAHDEQRLFTLCSHLSGLASTGAPGSEEVEVLLRAVLEELSERAAVAGMGAGLTSADVLEQVAQLTQLAEQLDAASRRNRGLARWLRGRAVELIDRTIAAGPTRVGEWLRTHLASQRSAQEAGEETQLLLSRIRMLLHMRDQLTALGADVADPEQAAKDWAEGLELIEQQMVPIWDEALRGASAAALEAVPEGQLNLLLRKLSPLLDHIEQSASLLRRLYDVHGLDYTPLTQRVVGPRIAPLVEMSFRRFDASDRMEVARQVDRLLADLSAAGLRVALPPSHLLRWSAEAMLRTEAEPPVDVSRLDPGPDGYGVLRAADARVSITFVLLDVVMRIYPPLDDEDPVGRLEERALSRLGTLPEELTGPIVDRDLDRVERAVALLETWWAAADPAIGAGDAGLMALSRSRFLDIAFDEHALARYRLEVQTVTRAFPAGSERAAVLEQRLRGLAQRCHTALLRAHRAGADTRWRQLLADGE